MLDTLLTIGYFLLGLSLLIVIHELGHYWAARIFGIKVEEFALFFGKKIVGFKRGETEWRINMIPLGGYVKIVGMLDENLDPEQVKGEPEPWEFRAKPTWQRLIVMLGGIIMNILLGILLFFIFKFAYGDNKTPISNLEYGIMVSDSSAGYDMGFRTGDIPLTYRGDTLEYLEELNDPNFLVDSDKYFEVKRAGKVVKLEIADDYIDTFTEFEEANKEIAGPDMIPLLRVPSPKDNVELQEAGKDTMELRAYNFGFRTGDVITAVDSTPIQKWSQFHAYVHAKEPETEIVFTVSRGNQSIDLTAQTDSLSRLGVLLHTDTIVEHVDYGVGEALSVGTAAAFGVITNTLKGLRAMIMGNADPRKSLSGPVKIAQIYGQASKAGGWAGFWKLTAFLSMVLAIMNLLPIPVLDGGQVLILTLEGIAGREIPIKTKEWILRISFYLVVGLMLLVVLNDVI